MFQGVLLLYRKVLENFPIQIFGQFLDFSAYNIMRLSNQRKPMDYIYFVIPAVLLLLALISATIFHFRKKSVIKKVNALSPLEKNELLNNLAKPVGYRYDTSQDIFVARLDATQKSFGYTTLYDLSAPFFNMIFDYETIYFNYAARTWLIEMWKGQYGINSGCELGIYNTDRVLLPEQYNSTLFNAVDTKDMPVISLKLNRHCDKDKCEFSKLGRVRQRHWWLTIFKMGCFTKPRELFLNASITFKDYSMLYSFVDSFRKTLPDTPCKISGLTIHFTFDKCHRKYSIFRRFIRSIALFFCKLYCKWFNCVTRPFTRAGDKILYLYYYLPFAVRRIFRVKRRHKHKKKGIK